MASSGSFTLTAPSKVVFIVALILAIIALLVTYGIFPIPFFTGYGFETLLLGFVLLVIGIVFSGI
ncbi:MULTISPECIES: hypothetical protein [unclassified Chelatococcus]|uniref:hypothetical protein n=1 Tax=unclassified Chelatococcus TaxID=2638111 RepID=UPI001BCC57E7|nr:MULTISPECIES: hypothetical protein [unclassified Chelatococcus]MBS7697792.1 hypothetical protein [Chelatococcus sp. YT9]MBX3559731.1 hypothetical protein [Chelatococcus sp.]